MSASAAWAPRVAAELGVDPIHAGNALRLLVDEEYTIPFVARYRKEVTGSMDEVVLRDLRDRCLYLSELDHTRERYLKVVAEYCKARPEFQGRWEGLKAKFMACETKQALEDLYLPFKPKRRTRAAIAREKGLEPLLEKILASAGGEEIADMVAFATAWVVEAESTVSPEDALKGAADILAERLNEDSEMRAAARTVSRESGRLQAVPVVELEGEDPKVAAKAQKYRDYLKYDEPVAEAASHRIMAVRRGEADGILRLKVAVDEERVLATLVDRALDLGPASQALREWVSGVVTDSYRRLMAPSLETEIRLDLKKRAEGEAIRVFAQNLEKLLLRPPIPNTVVCGIDPGLRTGCKYAVLSPTGQLLAHGVVHPQRSEERTLRTLTQVLDKHGVQYVAIGNGTGSKEIGELVARLLKEERFRRVRRMVVNEAGASVYSTDEIAREEFPDLDPTIRSAVSIGRRLQDPLAELVKIDPRSIGVGQYQHDCNVTQLGRTLKETVESCVNRVGVNVNTASYALLGYVAGLNTSLAKQIVAHRDGSGPYQGRGDLHSVKGFGPKAFEQAAGFLRIPGGAHPLDGSAVHPERYELVESMATAREIPLPALIGNEAAIKSLPLEDFVSEAVGMPTLVDISAELLKPGRDPRAEGTHLQYTEGVATLDDLKIGMKVKGTVSNVTRFGAFVDIGVHQDGLIHISELADEFVEDPTKVVSVGDALQVEVIGVDKERRRISLSSRRRRPAAAADADGNKKAANGAARPNGRDDSRRRSRGPSRDGRRPRGSRPPKAQSPQYSVDDLLAKFNNR